MADEAPQARTAPETDGAARWYDAILQLARIDALERRVAALEQAWQRQQTQQQAQSGETPPPAPPPPAIEP